MKGRHGGNASAVFLTRRLAQTKRAVTAIWLDDGDLVHGLNLESSPEAPGNSKNSTTFWGRLQKALFLGTSIVEREHA